MKIQQLGNDVCSHLSIRRINNGVKLQTDDIVLTSARFIDSWLERYNSIVLSDAI